jgi:hypothetical protein
MITILIPTHHPATLIARGRRFLFGRLLMANAQTLVVELRKPTVDLAGNEVIGVVFDSFLNVRDDRLAMMTVEFGVRCSSILGQRVVRLEVIEPQRVRLKTHQQSG